jgi:hypothetical protein
MNGSSTHQVPATCDRSTKGALVSAVGSLTDIRLGETLVRFIPESVPKADRSTPMACAVSSDRGDLGSVLILTLGKLLALAEDDRGAWRAALGSVPLR